jgi:hypothetical protein
MSVPDPRSIGRAAGRAIAAALFAAFAGAAWLALLYGRGPVLRMELDVAPPGAIVTGIHPIERDQESRRTFAWTAETLTIAIAEIDRQVAWTMEVHVRGARASGPQPELQFHVDGRPVLTHLSSIDFETVRMTIPPRPERSGMTLTMRAVPTFVPGRDPRTLGAMVDWLTLTPEGIVMPPRPALAGVALASAAAAAGLALLGVTAGTAVGAAVLLSAAIASLVARGFGPYTDFADVAARSAIWIGVVTALLTGAVRAGRRQPFKNTAKFAIAFSAAALLAKLLVLLHPDMPIGDALFQAHRFHEVLADRYYFTSLAPGNYQFPYAPGLYVVASPLAGFVRRAADMTLLRTVVCAADALAGLLLYAMAVRIRGDRLAGAIAVALYHLVPLGFGVVATGNLTNAFAQSLCVAALAIMAGSGLRNDAPRVALLTLVLLAAFLSHTSAFAIGSVGACMVALMFWLRGGPALRTPAMGIVLAALAAIVLAIAVYYAHFADVYRTELARIGTETAGGAPDAGGRGIAKRLSDVPRYLRLYFGLPILGLALWGTWLLWVRRARDRVTLTSAGWVLSCLAFFTLGILTPVDMRYYLAAVPVVALVAAIGGAIAWTEGRRRRLTAAALLAWSVVVAVRAWWSTLG